jgi:hypothetical protein
MRGGEIGLAAIAINEIAPPVKITKNLAPKPAQACLCRRVLLTYVTKTHLFVTANPRKTRKSTEVNAFREYCKLYQA